MSSSEKENESGLIHRVGARGVIVAPSGRILLMNLVEPEHKLVFWITPGGGLEEGESAERGLLRELKEEVGRDDFTVGPPIWTRSNRFTWAGQAYHQDETYYLIASDEFEVGAGGVMDAEERDAFMGFRWWSAEEIEESEETFAPSRLGALLARLLAEGPPDDPEDTG